MSGSKPTDLLGAVRPQTPHRSPRQAFGGNFQLGLPVASAGKTNTPKLFSLHDYMPVNLWLSPSAGIPYRFPIPDILVASAKLDSLVSSLAR
jgi:hypothetical protein